mmetsp:Transcript_21365/g.43120  ORF Transcript_21365/g.43120 Transcript_21365/m.43120 type:complete len:333 (-) Transcript_21365:408-1406(-)
MDAMVIRFLTLLTFISFASSTNEGFLRSRLYDGTKDNQAKTHEILAVFNVEAEYDAMGQIERKRLKEEGTPIEEISRGLRQLRRREKKNRKGRKETKDYRLNVGDLQQEPIRVNKYIVCIGTTMARAHAKESATISIPEFGEKGDLLVMIIGGSASGSAKPSDPPGEDWRKILEIGPHDLNLQVLWRPYMPESPNEYTISGGKNTYVVAMIFRGVDLGDPVVDIKAVRNSLDGKYGDALAPGVDTKKNGIIVGAFLYDDPHLATITNSSFQMTASFQSGDDGIAIGISTTDEGYHDPIHAVSGTYKRGGGNDIAAAISFQRNKEEDWNIFSH